LDRVVLKPRKARPFFGRHPWVLDSAIERVDGQPADGESVELVSDKGEFIARGIFNSRSRIAVRLYSWTAGEGLDEGFWQARLQRACRLRQDLGYTDPEGACRLVFSEGDGLSGLVVDRYRQWLVIQVTALAMAVRLHETATLLAELIQPRGILVRTEPDILRAEGMEVPEGLLWGDPPEGIVQIREHGLAYGVDLTGGQKTGWYLDQRENRLAAAARAGGRRVLDMFCYTGGFALMAAAVGQATDVLGIDASQKAVAQAQVNAAQNGIGNVSFQSGEAFQTMPALAAAGERFGMVVLDPPKFARHRGTVPDALRAYHRLNRLAIELLEPGGILVTCSCSGHVRREDFFHMLVGVAQQTGRDIQVLDARGPAPDHPVAVTCPETEYLKCFICRVL
jgi:23S rRNA (cytosine1962-C5)-methyltransferase